MKGTGLAASDMNEVHDMVLVGHDAEDYSSASTGTQTIMPETTDTVHQSKGVTDNNTMPASATSKDQNSCTALEGPAMALECPNLNIKDLYRLYWKSRDPVLRQRIFWKLWGCDHTFLKLVDEADILYQGTKTIQTNDWIERVLSRRSLGWQRYQLSWRNLTAIELSQMTLKEVARCLRRRSSPRDYLFSRAWYIKSVDLPARDIVVALAVSFSGRLPGGGCLPPAHFIDLIEQMTCDRQHQRIRAGLTEPKETDFKPLVRDPASRGCLDVPESQAWLWLFNIWNMIGLATGFFMIYSSLFGLPGPEMLGNGIFWSFCIPVVLLVTIAVFFIIAEPK